MINRALFLDRDGVINKLVKRDGGLCSPRKHEEFQLISDAKEAIEIAKSYGYLCIVVSNQPDITRGLMLKSELDKMTELMLDELKLDDVFYCIHDDYNDTGCRKPLPGMFLKAKKKWNINLNTSVMIGDSWRDVKAAKNIGLKMILLNTNYNLHLKVKNRIDHLLNIKNYIF